MAFRPLQYVILAFCLSLPGCLTSGEPVLAESSEATVEDFSGIYTSQTTGDRVIVARESDSRFSVKRGDSDPEEAILVPLDAAGTYLMQFHDGEEYALAVLLVAEDRVVVSFFAAAVQELLGTAFDDADHFRKLAASLLANKLGAILEKHAIEVDDEYALANRPAPEALIAFFNECVREPGTLTDGEILTKR